MWWLRLAGWTGTELHISVASPQVKGSDFKRDGSRTLEQFLGLFNFWRRRWRICIHRSRRRFFYSSQFFGWSQGFSGYKKQRIGLLRIVLSISQHTTLKTELDAQTRPPQLSHYPLSNIAFFLRSPSSWLFSFDIARPQQNLILISIRVNIEYSYHLDQQLTKANNMLRYIYITWLFYLCPHESPSNSSIDYLVASSIVAALMVCSTLGLVFARRGMGIWQYVAAILHVIGFIQLGEVQADPCNGSCSC